MKVINYLLPWLILISYRTTLILGDCDSPLIGNAKVKASSSLSTDRGPKHARLNGRIAWTAGSSDFSQYYTIDLGETKNVTAIATQGRPYTSEFVKEYRIEFGNGEEDLAEYKDSEGNTKLFKANKDGDTIQSNYFENPIIAQWIRINPTRWRDRISMRLEIYGCNYVEEVINFNGISYVRKDLNYNPIMSRRDNIRLRFKTNFADGVLIYSRGTQGDYFALQLVNNKLVLNIDLGSKQLSSITVGSLLDDNLWHDVVIYRNQKDVVFTVDRVIVRQKILGDFSQLDLNREIFVGGVPNFNVEGLIITKNFTGCIENLFINYTNLVREIKAKQDLDYTSYGLQFFCDDGLDRPKPLTFRTPDSHFRVNAIEGMPGLNVSVDFRTFKREGLLIYHKFANAGSIKVYLKEGRILVELAFGNIPGIIIDEIQESLNDGAWHRTMLIAADNYVELVVDNKPVRIHRTLKVKTGSTYWIGGGVHGVAGFVGCMRYMSFDGNTQPNIDVSGDIVRDSCQMLDRCNPNPCEHGGICYQNEEEFFCDCKNAGYGGAVCHTSLLPLSCDAFQQNNQLRKDQITIDIDGSGPLDPFPVTCGISDFSKITTTVGHRNEKTTTVNGFNAPGSFKQDIVYDANMDQITELVNRSRSCKQNLLYECRNSRLLNTPVVNRKFEPFSWWVSRQNQKMDYWAGAFPGTFKCACALHGTCVDNTRWCNCDAYRNEWQSDGGDLVQKEFLPVRQLRFGDTGSAFDNKQGRYTLGALICEDDYIYDNIITFRLKDATMDFPTFDLGHSGDIYFEFKTTAETGVFVHSNGTTDFIKISLVGGDQIQFTYDSGNGQLSVSVETNKLNDNKWHSVLVERNRKEAEVVVDGSVRNKIREPSGSSRAMYLKSAFVVGATVDLRDGYVGCMRALMLNGRPYDMRGPAERESLYGILPGVVGKCDSNPCLNNGTCLEGYSHYTCDCRWTAFKGPICADEIGVHLRKDDMIEYDFEGTYKSTTAEKIRVGFYAADPSGLLMGLSGLGGEYLSVVLANSADLKVVFDFGFERQEVISSYKLVNGQTHEIKISRTNGGRTMVIQVDNYSPEEFNFKIDKTQDVQFDNIRHLYIGRNRTMPSNAGFAGCITRVEFDDVYVLKLYFQEDRPKNIRSDPRELREDSCGIEAVTYPPEPTESRPDPTFDPSIIAKTKVYTGADSYVLGGILAIIFLALIAMAILIGRYLSRHKGEYKTHEDKGARDAPDADTAVIQGQTGHNVSMKKEIFL